jgi:hypothetical protein
MIKNAEFGMGNAEKKETIRANVKLSADKLKKVL